MSSGDEGASTSAVIKKRKYAQFYRKEWELDFPNWLEASSKNTNYAFCKSCSKDINISSGKDALKKHSTSHTHMLSSRNIKAQPKISSFAVKKTQSNDHIVRQGKTL